MKNIVIVISAFIISALYSCQKEINVDLNSATPQYVIEASLFEGTDTFRVRITKTSSYFNASASPTVDNAVVTIYENGSNAINLISKGNGIYELPNYTSIGGNTYKLKVVSDGKTFEASSILPQHVDIDTLVSKFSDFTIFQPGGNNTQYYQVEMKIQDPPVIKNYYRYFVHDNGLNNDNSGIQAISLFDDKLTNGTKITEIVRKNYLLGDKVDIELWTMDKALYEYFITLSTTIESSDGQSAAPANPNTNFNNGALGYFGAFTRSRKSIVIQ